MKLNIAIITLITVLMGTFAFANTLGLSDNGDGTWNVDYVSDGDIAGFQFNVDGAVITSASGGAAGVEISSMVPSVEFIVSIKMVEFARILPGVIVLALKETG